MLLICGVIQYVVGGWHGWRVTITPPAQSCQAIRAMQSVPVSTRVKKWCFTLNNPVLCVDYYNLLVKDGRCLRFVYGYEQASTGTKHLQGYIEFKSPVRFTVVQKLLSAHWESAKGSSAQNFRYCSKEQRHSVYGDWTAEIRACKNGTVSRTKFCYRTLVFDLLSDSRANAMLGSEYIRNKRNIDEIVSSVRELRVRHDRFVELRQSRVSNWQSECIVHTFDQCNRKVCWYVDTDGNKGKSYLAHLFYYVYQFDLFDGVTSARDICFLISDTPCGFVIDVTRSDASHFSYQTLEMLKNGYVMTGKYQGIRRLFKPKPVIVFSNFAPDTSKLSADRWCIHHLTNEETTYHPLPRPPLSPPALPDTPQEVSTQQEDLV